MNDRNQKTVRGILLAAGQARRFGGGKLLHCIDGIPIAVKAARAMLAAGLSVTAVVRVPQGPLNEWFAAEGVQVSFCPKADEGMGYSLAHGVAQCGQAQGWVVCLADMPYIHWQTIVKVREAVELGALIAAPVFEGKRAHPVGFGGSLYDELIALKGDEGARSVIQRYRDKAQWIQTQDAGVMADIDVPADLQKPGLKVKE